MGAFKKTNILSRVIYPILLSLLSFFILTRITFYVIDHYLDQSLKCTFEYTISQNDKFELFYTHTPGVWSEEFKTSGDLTSSKEFQHFEIEAPVYDSASFIRLDFGSNPEAGNIVIRNFTLQIGSEVHQFTKEEFQKHFSENPFMTINGTGEVINLTGTKRTGLWAEYDPFLTSDNLLTHFTNYTDGAKNWGVLLCFFFAFGIYIHLYYSRKKSANSTDISKNVRPEFVFSMIFILLLMLPWIAETFDMETKQAENRVKAPKPTLSLKNLKDYPNQYNKYYDDNFGFRSTLINYFAIVKYSIFRELNTDKVVSGKNGWFFHNDPNDNIVKYYTNTNLVSKEELAKWCNYCQNRDSTLRASGILYYKTFYPNTQSIYEEYVPDRLRALKHGDTSLADQIVTYLKVNNYKFQVIDHRPLLLAAKNKNVLYQRYDTHWNELGAYIAFENLMGFIKKDIPSLKPVTLSDYKVTWKNVPGDGHIKLLGVTDTSMFREDLPFVTPINDSLKFTFDNNSNWYDWVGNHISTTNPNARSQKKVLIFRDSFTQGMYVYLSAQFAKVVYVWKPFDMQIVEQEKPDIVIDGHVERYFY